MVIITGQNLVINLLAVYVVQIMGDEACQRVDLIFIRYIKNTSFPCGGAWYVASLQGGWHTITASAHHASTELLLLVCVAGNCKAAAEYCCEQQPK